jgi:hypothetical protein
MEYSIGDIVKVNDYGKRVAEQVRVSNAFKSKLTLPLNLDNKFTNTSYIMCNQLYVNQEWKIIDIIKICNGTMLMLRLRTRNREDMFIITDHNSTYLRLVRKSKSH